MQKIAIIYLSYNPRPYLDRVILALKKMTYPKDKVEFIVVDNPHPQFGSAGDYLKEKLMPLSQNDFPKVVILENEKNFGFAKGNNIGVEYALKNGFDLVFFHNQDGFMGLECLERLSRVFNEDASVGALQPLILLYPDHNLINTDGNKYNYLGFGYCGNRRKLAQQAPAHLQEINYASGAALMIKANLLQKYGAFREDFFAYHEDLELGLRLRCLGYKIMILPSARFYHEYEFSRNPQKLYLMERNRFSVIIEYYRLPTIILFLPMFLVTEIGFLFYAFLIGGLTQKLNAWKYWFLPGNFKNALKNRKINQSRRKIKDKELFKNAIGKIEFEGAGGRTFIKYIASPILEAYFYLARTLIFW